eukprot:Hpha_TRINITY_DN36515_c0_g1::TRINITY_DN36515_c0_g1_i1::g.130696::m.130696
MARVPPVVAGVFMLFSLGVSTLVAGVIIAGEEWIDTCSGHGGRQAVGELPLSPENLSLVGEVAVCVCLLCSSMMHADEAAPGDSERRLVSKAPQSGPWVWACCVGLWCAGGQGWVGALKVLLGDKRCSPSERFNSVSG